MQLWTTVNSFSLFTILYSNFNCLNKFHYMYFFYFSIITYFLVFKLKNYKWRDSNVIPLVRMYQHMCIRVQVSVWVIVCGSIVCLRAQLICCTATDVHLSISTLNEALLPWWYWCMAQLVTLCVGESYAQIWWIWTMCSLCALSMYLELYLH